MKFIFLKTPLLYDGSQLRSGFIKETTNISEDAIMAFTGACHVTEEHMVDLDDLKEMAFIHSDNMLHFLVEEEGTDLEKAVLRQRMLMVIIAEEIQRLLPGIKIKRDGDDLYILDKKLSVSIATKSDHSTLIHVGLNISSENTPVAAIGLLDLKIEVEKFSQNILEKYCQEKESVLYATKKVKTVS